MTQKLHEMAVSWVSGVIRLSGPSYAAVIQTFLLGAYHGGCIEQKLNRVHTLSSCAGTLAFSLMLFNPDESE